MNFNGIDFDTYFKHYPDENGYFGPYGGAYIPDNLKKAMQEIDEGIMAELRTLAHYVCLRKITKATLNLADGSVVTIGAKVSRARRLKVEEKVDE